MKKICCVFLVVLLCFSGCGGMSTLPELEPDEYETVRAGDTNYVEGEIIGKALPNALLLKVSNKDGINKWGKKVYIITSSLDKWCVGDKIKVSFSTVKRPNDTTQYVRISGSIKIIEKHESSSKNNVYDKPIIYFYPKTPTVCSVKLTLSGELICTYPEYGVNGWESFVAYPDGTLVFPDGKQYYALYWEAMQNADWDFSQGYCVRGEDTATFLEWALDKQGLTQREANEFIIYWLPLMQYNPYNVISFQTDAYSDSVVLEIDPAPDRLLRVFMAYYPSDTEVDIEPQNFENFERKGFTVVEWGGSSVGKR